MTEDKGRSSGATGAPQGPRERGGAPLLSVSGLSKSFSGTRALHAVSLVADAGEVVALLGENGSGKSTLIKVLAGYHLPDHGEVFVSGEPILGHEDPRHSRLRFIHQDLALVENMSVLDNLALGRGFHRRALGIDWHSERVSGRSVLAMFDPSIDVEQTVASLSPTQRTIVAIVRALEEWEPAGGVLVLDEPTAALPHKDVHRLYDVIREVARRGAAVILVSHRLEDVFAVADRAYVLRNGRLVGEQRIAECSERTLTELIVGRPLDRAVKAAIPRQPEVLLDVRDYCFGSVRRVSLQLHAGEILGLTGLIGSGHDELCSLLFGAKRRIAGEMRIQGSVVEGLDPKYARKLGLAYVPAERSREGCDLLASVKENMTLPDIPALTWRKFVIRRRVERDEVAQWIGHLRLPSGCEERPMATLSGGNQQKVVLAKWLRRHPRIVLLDEPTQGVDVGAKEEIVRLVREMASRGAGVIISSTGASDLASLCGRVLVMKEGRIVHELEGAAVTPQVITATIHGSLPQTQAAARSPV